MGAGARVPVNQAGLEVFLEPPRDSRMGAGATVGRLPPHGHTCLRRDDVRYPWEAVVLRLRARRELVPGMLAK